MTDAPYVVETAPTLNHSPAFKLATTGFVELMNAGLTQDEIQFDYSQRVIYAREDCGHKPVRGVMIWMELQHTRTAFMVFCYVHQMHRRRGLYRMMLAQLEQLAREKKLVRIEFGTHLQNAAMRFAGQRSQFAELYVVCAKHVEP